MIKVIIFDWGNVIEFFDDKLFYSKMPRLLKVNKDLFKKIEFENRIKLEQGKISTQEVINKLNNKLELKLTIKQYGEYIHKIGFTKINLEIIKLIKELKKSYQIYLLSNNSKPSHDEIIKSKYHNLFNKMLFSYQVKLQKPDPKIFKKIIKNTGFTAEECIFIDDLEKNCEGASKAGMYSIVFYNNNQLKNNLKKLLS